MATKKNNHLHLLQYQRRIFLEVSLHKKIRCCIIGTYLCVCVCVCVCVHACVHVCACMCVYKREQVSIIHTQQPLSVMSKTPISLQINCGYARVAIKELTPTNKSDLDPSERAAKFQQLFSIPSYELPTLLFEPDDRHRLPFDRKCDPVLELMKKSGILHQSGWNTYPHFPWISGNLSLKHTKTLTHSPIV